jgi:hypothetical protein
MSAPVDLPFDLDTLPPAVREAFAAVQAKVAGLEARTERQDYLIAELRHALYGKRPEQLPPDERQLAFEDLETAVAEAEAARDALAERNADGKPRRPVARRNLGRRGAGISGLHRPWPSAPETRAGRHGPPCDGSKRSPTPVDRPGHGPG